MAAIILKCLNCGGDLQFDPESQNYKCEYCLSMFTQEQMDTMLERTESPKHKQEQTDHAGRDDRPAAVLYNCPSCGAEIVTDETTAATFCYYCHNPVVLSGRLQGEYMPDYAIPFAINREKVTEIFSQWMKKKKYVPKAFFSENQIEKITGVYFPYWTYSCVIDGRLEAEGKKLRTWVSGNIRSTETSKYLVERSGQMKIRHVPRNALKKANRQLVEGVFPYNMEQLKPFSMGYLSGFQAENRDISRDDYVNDVEQEVRSYAQEQLKAAVGNYDAITIRTQQADLTQPVWNYALMPVWTLTYKDPSDDKIYYFACNGQSGKVCGQLPVDKTRLGILFISVFIPIFIVLLFVGWLI